MPDDLSPEDLERISEDMNESSERYRDRHLSVRLSSYSSFFAFAGLTLPAAAFLATASTGWALVLCRVCIFLSMVSALIVFLLHHWILRLYDTLGFKQADFRTKDDVDRYYDEQRSAAQEFYSRHRLRKRLEFSLYAIAIAQIAILGASTFLR